MVLKPKTHFIILDQFSPVGLEKPFPHGGTQTAFLLDEAQGGLLHEMLSVCPRLVGNVKKLGFLLGGEIYFHGYKIESARPYVNAADKALALPCRSQLFFQVKSTT